MHKDIEWLKEEVKDIREQLGEFSGHSEFNGLEKRLKVVELKLGIR